MSPRTLISIDFLVCGMLFPLSTSISVSHQLNSVSNFSSGTILSTTLSKPARARKPAGQPQHPLTQLCILGTVL